jgi:putative nucleotidyltransferase with HDIG domain
MAELALMATAEDLDRLLARTLGAGNVYSVGGRVRDEVLAELGRPQEAPQDLDYLVASVPYDEIVQRLRRLGSAELVGASFGVIKFTYAGTTVDIALPRRERSTGTHHRAFEVESSPDIPISEDLRRRDFRINMMARDVASGELLDPYKGVADLQHGRLDILNDGVFLEDPLRILRGAQFAARFELAPTQRTRAAMTAAAHLVPTVAPERVADELMKLFTKAKRPSIGLELLRSVGALEFVMPELLEGVGVEQNEFHRYTVYEHALAACDESLPVLELRLAGLLHDVAKPRTKSGPHFYRHEVVGEEMVRTMLSRLRFAADTVNTVALLVRHHMFASDQALTDAAVRRFIHRVGAKRVQQLFELRRADIIASGFAERNHGEFERFTQRVRLQMAGPSALRIEDLAIDGNQVMALMRELGLAGEGFRGDARVGAALRACLDAVLEDPGQNTRERLREIARDFLARKER